MGKVPTKDTAQRFTCTCCHQQTQGGLIPCNNPASAVKHPTETKWGKDFWNGKVDQPRCKCGFLTYATMFKRIMSRYKAYTF